MATYNEPKNDYTKESQVTPSIFNELAENERYLYEKRCAVIKRDGGTENPVNELIFDKIGNYYEVKTRKNSATSNVLLNVSRSELAGKLTDGWTTFTKDTVIPYGVYLISVTLADNTTGIGPIGTMITDIMAFYSTTPTEIQVRGDDYPGGPIHIYCANDREGRWFRTARVKVTGYTTSGFKLNLYVSSSGGYYTSSTDIKGNQFYPETTADSTSYITYIMKYKRIM